MIKPYRKYRAQPTEVDGIRFASKKEAARFNLLKVMQREKKIRDLELQVVFPMCVVDQKGTMKIIAKYIADFSYVVTETGEKVVEDVKGMKTPVYRLKKKHVEAQYGIEIKEI